MAALTRPTTANYEVHENVRVDTIDNEDHTFCGIMFPIQAKADLPVSRLVIRSLSVRGHLGPMTVWVTNDDFLANREVREVNTMSALQRIRSNQAAWNKVYEKNHQPSRRKYQVLDLSANPIVLQPGQMRMVYIHSAAHHDLAIVYDNSYSMRAIRYSDAFLSIYSGAAHLSPEPFQNENIWGWGSGWREYREFVGQVDFGAIYQLWSPELHFQFGSGFQQVTQTILACQRRQESPISMLPDECIYYILNMCKWDWFEDTCDDVGAQRKRSERREKRQAEKAKKVSKSCETRSLQRSSRRSRSSSRLSFFGSVRDKIAGAFS